MPDARPHAQPPRDAGHGAAVGAALLPWLGLAALAAVTSGRLTSATSIVGAWGTLLAVTGALGALSLRTRRARLAHPAARLSVYVAVLLCVLVLAERAVRYDRPITPDLARPDLKGQQARYLRHAERYDLVFLGDSRTFCGIDPLRLDPRLDTHAINLATMGHWFPNQYAQMLELVPRLPPGTTVVWSIGHVNFNRSEQPFNHTYPVGWRNIPRYLALGYRWEQLTENLKRDAPAWFRTVPGLGFYVETLRLNTTLHRYLAAPLGRPPSAPGDDAPSGIEASAAQQGSGGLPELGREERRYFADLPSPWPPGNLDAYLALAHRRDGPEVQSIRPWMEGGRITSAAIVTRRGNHVRIEIEPAYFRARQREMAAHLEPAPARAFEPDPARWRTFVAILDLFAGHDVRLVVNELEEAPYFYRDPGRAEHYRGFMRDRVRPFVESRGVPYVRTSLEQLDDADYFDFNHLNDRGIDRFTPMLAEALRPYLPR